MARWNEVGKVATTVSTRDGYTSVVYHSTEVVRFNDQEVILDSGGYRTRTTAVRMNQASAQYDLGFRVYQEKHQWYAALRKDGIWDWDNPIPFVDGIRFLRMADRLILADHEFSLSD